MTAAGDKARAAWGDAPPWVSALAAEVDATSLGRAAARIGFSKATVSLVLSRRYGADCGRVRNAVMAVLGAGVACPVLGDIDAERCRAERSAPFRPGLPLAGLLRTACRSCPQNDGGER